jgi:hypothetical protein
MAGSRWETEFPAPQLTEAAAPAPARSIGFADIDRVEVSLLHPLTVDGERIEALTVRRITAAEMIKIIEAPNAPKADAELTRHVVAAMAGYPLEVLDALSPDDSGRVASAALPFMPAALVEALERAASAEAEEVDPG